MSSTTRKSATIAALGLALFALASTGANAEKPSDKPVNLNTRELDSVAGGFFIDFSFLQAWSISSNTGQTAEPTRMVQHRFFSDVEVPSVARPGAGVSQGAFPPVTDSDSLRVVDNEKGVVVTASSFASSCCNGPSSSVATSNVSVSSLDTTAPPSVTSASASPVASASPTTQNVEQAAPTRTTVRQRATSASPTRERGVLRFRWGQRYAR